MNTRSTSGHDPAGQFVTRDGRRLYEITHVDQMPPFLMTVVCDADLWLYISSSGGLTAGRVEPARCLFPYETSDRLDEAGGINGAITLIRLPDGTLWRPLLDRHIGEDRIRRLLRTPVGDAVVFEEVDHTTGLTFRAEWALSATYGIVRQCTLELAADAAPVDIEILDGLLNVMPADVPIGTQQTSSTLVDAYKRSELDTRTSLATFLLEAAISDQPEARESLRANIVWRAGLADAAATLNPDAVLAFERGQAITPNALSTGRRGAYLCHARLQLAPCASEQWAFVGDVHLDQATVVDRQHWIASTSDHLAAIRQDLQDGVERLAVLLDQADGSQVTADEAVVAAHRSNVLFNTMRGGAPADGYTINVGEFRCFVQSRHIHICRRHDAFLKQLGASVTLEQLLRAVETQDDPQLVRLAMEYLPLTFGRRHGDPSRPWNQFRIHTRDARGNRALGYEGNWRDIFQNWEAMCRSYPELLPNVIAKFVNASTPDGHNPYRISESGIDWEVPDPDDPWSNIGYWGDHQLIYLLRLLQQLQDTDPGALTRMLNRQIFSYADLPYVIRSFDSLVRNPDSSIHFDRKHHAAILARAEQTGADGRLVLNEDGEPHLASLTEKLLVTALAKISNLVPGGGIWMNTQRPEWNDANNALAGHGLSMVTLYHLRCFSDFCIGLMEQLGDGEAVVSDAVIRWCEDVLSAFVNGLESVSQPNGIDDTVRWSILEMLGQAASRTRERIAEKGFGESRGYAVRSITDLFRLTRHVCDDSIAAARRKDGLYESYNVLHLDVPNRKASVERLHPMLEGQVAVLSSGVLDTAESIRVLETLFDSDLYREDQRTFILYPHIDRPGFLERNIIPEDAISPLLKHALNNGIVQLAKRDKDGNARFAAELVTRAELEECLDTLAEQPTLTELVEQDAAGVRDAYERVFQHARFTGRSGTMHKYEGIGSVYWHMVSKLMLAAQECASHAISSGESPEHVQRLIDLYRRVRGGLGMYKTPAEFGAVPHEPYSHTPWHMGAQQPGMTGQVKEGVLARFGELGISLRGGELTVEPSLLDPDELLNEPTSWRIRGVIDQTIDLPAGSLGFSVCGIPVILSQGDQARASLHLDDGTTVDLEGTSLGKEWTTEVFGRTGRITRITVESPEIGTATRTVSASAAS
jgi:hypothetical protein